MKHSSLFVLALLAFAHAPAVAQAENPEILAFVSGGSTGKIFRIDAEGVAVVFSANQGFKPQSLDTDGYGRLFVCDPSNSEIHVLERDAAGAWQLTTIFDKDNAVPPSPEQPVGCNVVGADLYFGERSGSGAEHGVWVMRGAAVTPTAGPFGAPELVAVIDATGGDELTDIAFAPGAQVLASQGTEILVAGPPGFDTFVPLISNLAGEASAVAANSVGEIFVAFADLGIVEVFDGSGASCGIYTDVSPLRPIQLEFDLGDNLYVAAPKLQNGKNGDVFVVAPNGGPATHQCDFDPPTVPAVPLADPAPPAETGVALPPSSVSQELIFEDDQPLTAKLCSALFTLDPEFLNDLADPTCPVTVTCRLMPQAEFQTRTDVNFPNTTCMDIPIASGNCVEMVVDGAECFGGITEAEWIFFVTGDVGPEDRPGLLYSQDVGPEVDYTDNILAQFDAVVPDLPNDPAMIGRTDEFGTGLVGVINAPNRAPVADAGADQTLECGTATVTIDGSASFDLDPIDDGQLSFSWTGPAIPAGAEDDPSFVVDVSLLGPGLHTWELTVNDSGLFSDEGPLSATDSVTVEVAGSAGTTIEALVADPDTLWPPNHEMVPVVLTAEAADGCTGDAVSCLIVAVTSSDPVGGPDDPDTGDGGNTSPDWKITGLLTLDLRSERSEGGDSVDNARVYTITVHCGDPDAGGAEGTVEVTVVSDQGG